jgi:hypothetical protein
VVAMEACPKRLDRRWHRLAKEHFTATVGPVAMSDLADLLTLPECSRRRATH